MPAYVARRFLHRLLASTALSGLGAFATIGPAAIEPAAAGQLPTGYATAYGNVGFQRSSGTLTIDQKSQGAIVDYNSFSIGRHGTVNIRQPNGAAVLVNRVNGSTPSTIAGRLDANGQVYLINPNGIAITKHGVVKVGGGFVASSLAMSNDELMRHRKQFKASGRAAAVSNAGTITVGRRGYAALIGGEVTNSGTISVPMGKVALGSGEMATLDVSGDGFLQVAVPTAASGKGPLVSDSGSILAAGGTVVLDAATARAAARNAVNISGSIDSHSISGRSGAIVIGGGDGGAVEVSGRLDASSDRGKGGAVTITGAKIALRHARVYAQGAAGGGAVRIGGDLHGGGTLPHARTVSIDKRSVVAADATRKGNGGSVVVWSDAHTTFAGRITARGGPAGGSGGAVEVSSHGTLAYTGTTDVTAPRGAIGTLLLDPYNVVISNGVNNTGGSFSANTDNSVINAATLDAALATADVTITTGSGGTQGGRIKVAAPIAWSSPTMLTLTAAKGIAIDAPLKAAAGGLTLDAGGKITATGSIAVARYIQDAGAFVQDTSKLPTFSAGDFEIAGGTFLRATGGTGKAASPYLIDDIYGLQGIGTMPTRHFALAGDIDASGTATWNAGAGFVPIGTATTPFTGTLDGAGHSIANLAIDLPSGDDVGLFGVIGAKGTVKNVTLAGANVTGEAQVGTLAGVSQGKIVSVAATGAGALAGVDTVGGLVGASSGTIVRSSSTTTITDDSAGTQVGGLVGASTGRISESYATGAIQDTGGTDVGGLAGSSSGKLTNVYATGSVTAPYATDVGSLLGYNSGTVTDSYAVGYVGATYGVDHGGLAGDNEGTFLHSYWNIDTTAQPNAAGTGSAAGATGLSQAKALQAASYAGFDFAKNKIWNIVPGLSFPYLQFQFPHGAPQVISGTALRAPLLGSKANNGSPDLFGYTVGGVVDGQQVGYTTIGKNGFYDLLVAPGTISKSGSGIITYFTGYPTGDSFYAHATGSVTGLDMSGHYLTLYSGAPNVTDIARQLAKALGSQTGSEFIFSVGPAPRYELSLDPDPLGLPSGSQLAIFSSAKHLDLDQIPALSSSTAFFLLDMTKSNSVVRQEVPIPRGNLSLIGPTSTFVLDNSLNNISDIAADVKKLTLADSAMLTIGKVNSINGLTAATASIDDPKGVKQAEPINAHDLSLTGASGTFDLQNPKNDISVLAAKVQTLKLSDESDLVIGMIGGVAGVTATTFSLDDPSAVSQTQAVDVKNLLLAGQGGTVTLNDSANDIGNLAGDAGTLTLSDKKDLTIGQVFGTNGLTAGKISIDDKHKVAQSQSISAQQLVLLGRTGTFELNDVHNSISMLAAEGRVLNVADGVSLDLGKIGKISGVSAANLLLNDSAGVKQTQPLSVSHLGLRGIGGVFSLINTANKVGKVAADAKVVRLADARSLSIGAVGGVRGINVTSLSLDDKRPVTQSQPITSKGLLLLGSHGAFNLPSTKNKIHRLAARTGRVVLANKGPVSVGSVLGVSGVGRTKIIIKKADK